jgi:hypothetical protein
MSESQRAMIAARLANMPVGRNWDNSPNLGNSLSPPLMLLRS